MDDIEVTVADINGDALYMSHSISGQNFQSGPHSFELSKLYPNPFNPSTEVSFSLPMDDHVHLAAYDVRGQEVDIIFEGAQSVGQHMGCLDNLLNKEKHGGRRTALPHVPSSRGTPHRGEVRKLGPVDREVCSTVHRRVSSTTVDMAPV